MKTLQDLYTFYIENCVDETKNEIPLNYKEWIDNYGNEELNNLTVYDIYDEKTNKTLPINANSLEEAERISETLDFDSLTD
jgi:hypothetical protein